MYESNVRARYFVVCPPNFSPTYDIHKVRDPFTIRKDSLDQYLGHSVYVSVHKMGRGRSPSQHTTSSITAHIQRTAVFSVNHIRHFSDGRWARELHRSKVQAPLRASG